MNNSCDASQRTSKTLLCNICLEEPQITVATRCGHVYCSLCLRTWLERGSMECPVCKATVKSDTVIRIFSHKEPTVSSQSISVPNEPSSVPVLESDSTPFTFGPVTSPDTGAHGLNRPYRSRPNLFLDDSDYSRRAISNFLVFLGIMLVVIVISLD